jgi:hypothetical protein
MKNKMPKKRIVDFYKKYFTQVKKELLDGEELTVIYDESFTEEDNEVMYYLEFNGIGYSNEEILEMIDSEVE